MSITTEIERLQSLKTRLKDAGNAMGIIDDVDMENITLEGVTALIEGINPMIGMSVQPGTEDKTVGAGSYIKDGILIKGDANLLPQNIAEGVSIFSVMGTYTGAGKATIGYNTGTFTLTKEAVGERVSLTHSLGKAPELVMYWIDQSAISAVLGIYEIVLCGAFNRIAALQDENSTALTNGAYMITVNDATKALTSLIISDQAKEGSDVGCVPYVSETVIELTLPKNLYWAYDVDYRWIALALPES